MVWGFIEKCLIPLQNLLEVDNVRVYSIEFPIVYEKDAGRVDLILEIVKDGDLFNKKNPLLVFEFKKDKIKYGPVDQLQFYMKTVKATLYRQTVIGFLAAPTFSVHEIEEATKAGFHCLQFDLSGNLNLLS
jgi:RecB family endonuclease NucS